jgi:hypothetical protein
LCIVIEYKISIQKSVDFLYINNAQTEKEIGETILFIIALKTINKVLWNKLMKETKDLFNENCKPLKREIKEDIRRWRVLPCSCVDRIIIVKMATQPKAIYKFSEIIIKISMTVLTEIEKSILKYMWKHKRP